MNRRGFLKNSGQMVIAGGLVAMAGYLLFREKPEEQCNIDFACNNCHKSKSCTLPEAKQNQNKQ